MDRALLAAVSGIDANQTYLDAIGNNIANVNTVGYKAESVDFVDLLTEQISGAAAPGGPTVGAGVNPMAVGSGVRVGAINTNLTQGSFEQTDVPTDVAIQGNGYLIALQNGLTYYTRAGDLVLDADGNLATPTGGLIQGWQANANGVIDVNAPTTAIGIPTGQVIAAKATTTIDMGGNLPANDGTSTQSYNTTINAYDSLGTQVPVTFTFTPTTTAGEWELYGSVPSATKGDWSNTELATIQFNPSTGQVETITPVDADVTATQNTDGSWNLSVPVPNNANDGTNYTFPATDPNWTIHFPAPTSANALTQFAGQDTAEADHQDGSAGGVLESYSIGSNGVITGSFSNGQTQALAQIALADFANPGGLDSVGTTYYTATPNSGAPLIGTPGTGGRGTLVGGSVEESNVDLAKQLTDLIVAQEAYEANTKVVTTSATTLQALMNIP